MALAATARPMPAKKGGVWDAPLLSDNRRSVGWGTKIADRSNGAGLRAGVFLASG